VVIASFFATSQSLAGSVPGMALCLLAGLLIGCVNAFLVQGLRINAIIATIGTMGIVQGLAVILRPEPGGLVGFGLTEFFSRQYGFVPVVFVYIAVAVVVLHLALTRTTLGLRARATGLAAENSRRMGIRVERNRVLAFVVCGGLAGIAGIIVASQVGVGSNSVGTSYALTSVTVCFLAGASLSGGKGNFLVVLLGALFVALLINVAALVNVRTETVLMVTGGLTILAVAFQTQGERLRRRAETR
jgi:ribose transport system ATP-binding protein